MLGGAVNTQKFITNTKRLDGCDLKLSLGEIMLPKFPVPNGQTERSYLDQLVYKGLVYRYSQDTNIETKDLSINQCKKLLPKNIIERADYELNVVDSMNFSGYFLIIWDFIKWGKDRKIVFGQVGVARLVRLFLMH